ncbi:hypothetical protein MHIB_34340 [Mycolicibacter hiberniae]|uniref:Alanine and proline rich membrane protein n=1 Tax=Mycolicibacter hiberniae TaxID=29314 RepID=A0A7I7X5N2_9MYCO|nr:hypothetical protein MHIB_34340 [Mycolicibacter hiberniae]
MPASLPPARAGRPAIALAALAVLISATALMVALTRPSEGAERPFTATQRADAKDHLCRSYRLAAHAEHIETNMPDNAALGRLSATNGALILQTAAADPAVETKYRDAARNLALSYQKLVAIATGRNANDPEITDAIADANAKDRVMVELCGE